MVKKQYYKVIGLKNGKGLTELAQFDEKKDANWHIKSTFEALGFDKLLVKAGSVKDKDLYVKAEDAQIKEPFINTLIIMNKLDWETVTTHTQFNTLLGFLHSKELEKTAQLGKLSDVVTSDEVEINEDEFAVSVIQDLNTPLPLDKAKTKLTKAIMDELLGSDDSEEEEEEEEEDVSSEEDEPAVEVVVDEPVVEVVEPVVEVVEPIVEEVKVEVAPVIEEVVEEAIEEAIEEVIEETPVVENEVLVDELVEEAPVVEETIEEVTVEPVAEKEVDISDLLSDDVETVVAPVVEETKEITADDIADFDFDI